MKTEEITKEILRLKQQATQNIIDIGLSLIKAKSALNHGEWLEWLSNEVDFTERTAQRMMMVAREFPNTTTLSFSKMLLILQMSKKEQSQLVEEPMPSPPQLEQSEDETTAIYYDHTELIGMTEQVLCNSKNIMDYINSNEIAMKPREQSDISHRLQIVIKELMEIDISICGTGKKYYDTTFGKARKMPK